MIRQKFSDSLLQLHFQARELIPTSISCLGCMPQSGKHHYKEFLPIFAQVLFIMFLIIFEQFYNNFLTIQIQICYYKV